MNNDFSRIIIWKGLNHLIQIPKGGTDSTCFEKLILILVDISTKKESILPSFKFCDLRSI